jgi:hypothetical protein
VDAAPTLSHSASPTVWRQESLFDPAPAQANKSDGQFGSLDRDHPTDIDGAPSAMQPPANDAADHTHTQQGSATMPTEPVTASMPEQPDDKDESARTSPLTQLSDPAICAAPTDPSHAAPEQSQVEPVSCDSSKHGHFRVHVNTDAMETISAGAGELYSVLLSTRRSECFEYVDDARPEPVIRALGTKDLIDLLLAERMETDPKLQARQEEAKLCDELKIFDAKERDNVRRSIKAARKELSAKFFVQMIGANCYTHETIIYSVYLPMEVLRRQHTNGWLKWRKGGNRSRILVDAKGQDMPHQIKDGSKMPITTEADRESRIAEAVAKEVNQATQGAKP